MKLVIVESPTKSRKIQEFLGAGYEVAACVGHVRDLPTRKDDLPEDVRKKPWADYAVDVENGFRPYYIAIPGKEKTLRDLKAKLKIADELYLATDPDREGEAISWHLLELLQPKQKPRRVTFEEITKQAVQHAIAHPRDIDMNLVQAQETRRILDRLYGYALSPLLWRKVQPGLSAGRVQSVAVRFTVERERERRAFRSATYWDLTAQLEKGDPFDARLVALAGKRIATGKDFDKETGRITAGRDVLLLGETQARELQARLPGVPWKVTDVQKTEKESKPDAPFVTATLQQEANNRLGMGAKETMSVAQRLFEEGFITYMRTDSPILSEEGMKGAHAAVKAHFGANFLQSRTYEGKTQKGAQEAHEAIRPAGEAFTHPSEAGLKGRDLAVYTMIWSRTVASQMANERYVSTSVTIAAAEATFVATGKEVTFAGYRAAYARAGLEGKEDPDEEESVMLPPLRKGDVVECKAVEAEGHATKPPARYTEASLVKMLVENRIGRPSTYAAILDTIESRGYVHVKGKQLVPSFTAFAVVQILERHFPKLVDPAFTADMEESLDSIAAGEGKVEPFLAAFFLGHDGLQADIERKLEAIDGTEGRTINLGGAAYKVKVGKFGAYVEAERAGEIVRATLPEDVAPGDLDDATVERLLQQKAAGPQSIGKDEDSGLAVYVLDGRFGPYVQLGEKTEGARPKSASLPKGRKSADVTLNEALFLLSLPKLLGEHPKGGDVVVGLGRFGPYVAHSQGESTEYRSLPAAQALQDVTLDQALDLLGKPKAKRQGPTVLKEMGPHPDDKQPIRVLDGKYGPYVKHGDLNATVPKGVEVSDLTLEQALRILGERAARPPSTKPKGRRR